MADDREPKTVNLTEPLRKGVSDCGNTQEFRDSQMPAKPAHYSQPEKLTIPPAAPTTGGSGNPGSGTTEKK
jgi:hypothetical protein